MAKKFRSKRTRDSARSSLQLIPRNRSGLSTIVITLIIVALSMAAIVLVWTFVSSMIKKQITSSESCFGNTEKVTINRQYTCYEKLSDTKYNLRFSLSIGDVKVEKVIASVASRGEVKSYQITNIAKTFPDLKMYSGVNPNNVVLPLKNAGRTYNATGFTSAIDSIQIAPVIGETQCEVSDSLSGIENCAIMA